MLIYLLGLWGPQVNSMLEVSILLLSVNKIRKKKNTTKHISLDFEDPLEEEMSAHSSTLAWKIPWTEQPGWHSPWRHKVLDTIE